MTQKQGEQTARQAVHAHSSESGWELKTKSPGNYTSVSWHMDCLSHSSSTSATCPQNTTCGSTSAAPAKGLALAPPKSCPIHPLECQSATGSCPSALQALPVTGQGEAKSLPSQQSRGWMPRHPPGVAPRKAPSPEQSSEPAAASKGRQGRVS